MNLATPKPEERPAIVSPKKGFAAKKKKRVVKRSSFVPEGLFP